MIGARHYYAWCVLNSRFITPHRSMPFPGVLTVHYLRSPFSPTLGIDIDACVILIVLRDFATLAMRPWISLASNASRINNHIIHQAHSVSSFQPTESTNFEVETAPNA